MDIEHVLCIWDKKSTEPLLEVYASIERAGVGWRIVADCCTESAAAPGATWLLKQYCDIHKKLPLECSEEVLSVLYNTHHAWQAILHVLQLMEYLTVEAEQKNLIASSLRRHIHHENKFVRAWAYSALFELSLKYKEMASEVQELLVRAVETESASVRARIRQIEKRRLRVR